MKENGLSILVAASEAAPLAMAGGLGDVIGNLPLALRDLGCRVAVVLPAYRQALARIQDYKITTRGLKVPMGRSYMTADVLVGDLATGVPVLLIRQDEFYDRDEIYDNGRGEYPDNPERFIFFSHSIPTLCLSSGFHPDIILANDWHTGLVMPLLAEGILPRTAGVFAIHNMGYLGLVPGDRKKYIGLPEKYYGTQGLEYYGQMSLLKAGILYSQAVTTVSPSYAREIQTPEYGSGLDGLMRSIRVRLFGILNGVDYQAWSPATDTHIKANYSTADLSGKRLCKQELLKVMGLPDELSDRPLVGMVTRLVDQKGCNLVAEGAKRLFDLDIGIVLLGTGDEKYRRLFSTLQSRYPRLFGLKLGFDEDLAHKILAGSDMLLTPSLYEPCGLTTMCALHYGTIPIVRATGGLRDTVLDPNEGDGHGTGFKFSRFQSGELIKAIERAYGVFQERKRWKAMMLNAMAREFFWRDSAREYLAVFDQAIAARRGIKQ